LLFSCSSLLFFQEVPFEIILEQGLKCTLHIDNYY